METNLSEVGPAVTATFSFVAVVISGLAEVLGFPAVERTEDLLVGVPGQGEEFMDPFPFPLGQKREIFLSTLFKIKRTAASAPSPVGSRRY